MKPECALRDRVLRARVQFSLTNIEGPPERIARNLGCRLLSTECPKGKLPDNVTAIP